MASTPTVFRDALVVTQDAERRVVRADVRVENGRFAHVGERAPTEGAEVVDAHGYALVPGFVNAHTHVAMAPLRGLADDRDLGGFLERLCAGVAEMLLSGTTSFLDLYYFEDGVARAVDALGARGFLGWAVLDAELTTQKGAPLDNAKGFLQRWSGNPRVQPLVAPQGVYVCNEATWLGAKAIAEAHHTLVHYHLSETRREVHEHEKKTGLRPPLWLDKIGFLGPGQVAAHGVWMMRREIETLARRSVGVAHCPSSNMKLATGGVAPVREMRECGVTVGLGTDSVASNNSLSMLREMHVAGLLQKHQTWDASVLPAQALLDMATIEGARLLGRSDDLGSIEVGKRADFSMVRLDHPTLLPARPGAIVSHLAYSASEEAIESVFVEGEPVVRQRELVRGSWRDIRQAAEAAADSLWGGDPATADRPPPARSGSRNATNPANP